MTESDASQAGWIESMISDLRGESAASTVSAPSSRPTSARATVEPVAESPERMEAILRATFVDARLSGSDLSGEARSILRDAQGEGYTESHSYSEPYRTILTELHARAYLDGTVEKDAYVEDPGAGMALYDETYYRYRLRFLAR